MGINLGSLLIELAKSYGPTAAKHIVDLMRQRSAAAGSPTATSEDALAAVIEQIAEDTARTSAAVIELARMQNEVTAVHNELRRVAPAVEGLSTKLDHLQSDVTSFSGRLAGMEGEYHGAVNLARLAVVVSGVGVVLMAITLALVLRH